MTDLEFADALRARARHMQAKSLTMSVETFTRLRKCVCGFVNVTTEVAKFRVGNYGSILLEDETTEVSIWVQRGIPDGSVRFGSYETDRLGVEVAFDVVRSVEIKWTISFEGTRYERKDPL